MVIMIMIMIRVMIMIRIMGTSNKLYERGMNYMNQEKDLGTRNQLKEPESYRNQEEAIGTRNIL